MSKPGLEGGYWIQVKTEKNNYASEHNASTSKEKEKDRITWVDLQPLKKYFSADKMVLSLKWAVCAVNRSKYF